MSRIKDNIFVNGQLVGNPIRKEICQTENGRCDQCFNVPETNKGREKNKRSLTKIKIWDPVWITPFGDTACLIRNKICKKSHCIGKWIELEKHFSKASKHVVTSQENKENCAISSNNTNGRKHCSKPSIRQPGHQNNSEKQMSRQYENKTKKNKKRHHVIPGMSSSAAIVPFLSTQSIILRHYIFFGKYIIKIMAILFCNAPILFFVIDCLVQVFYELQNKSNQF